MYTLLLTIITAVAISSTEQAAPELIAPGVVSTTDGEYSPTYDPARGELVFMRRTPGRLDYTLYVSRRDGSGWTKPKVLPFSGTDRDGGAAFSPDGQRLLFDSERPDDRVARRSINIWRVARDGDDWGEPELIEQASINDPTEPAAGRDEYGPTETPDGSIVFYSFRQPLRGGSLYAVTGDAPAARSTTLPDPSAATFVAYLTMSTNNALAVIEGRNRAGRDTDLFFSCRAGDVWSTPMPLEAANSRSNDGTPYLTSDGKMLLFASERPTGDTRATVSSLYSIDLASLDLPCT
ncbi:MAG: hypothetical protein AAF229_01745 [Pseudomonadota bacterium]